MTTPSIATSENGWTDDEVGFAWFKDVFVPQAVERNRVATEKERAEAATAQEKEPSEGDGSNEESCEEPIKLPPILLIYDGHGSHTTLDWVTLARENNIILFCLPPHTTHRLQPLDVGCFGPLQIAWFNRCDEILDETGEGMEMKEVVTEYFVARRKAFKTENILKAWKNSGLRPLNPDLFNSSDFAPSHSSSTQRHAPSSFPSKMPHVADASSDDGMFDAATFQHVIDVNNDSAASGSDDTESISTSSSSDLDSIDSDQEIEYTRRHADILANDRFREIDAAYQAEASASESESDSEVEAAVVMYPNPDSSTACPQTPSNQTPHTTLCDNSEISPCYTRSRRRESLAIISEMANTPGPEPLSALTEDPTNNEVIQRLKRELRLVESERDSARVHAVFADRQAAILQYRLNKKQTKINQTSRRIHTKSRVVTNDVGLEEVAEDFEKQQEKKRKAAEKQARKAAKQKEDLVRRAVQGSTRVFTGSLSSKNKTELEDIGDALGLDISGTKAVLVARITGYFNEHPRFKEDPRYSGLFERSRGRKRPALVDENQLDGLLPQDQANPEHIAQRRRLHPPPVNAPMGTITNTVLSGSFPAVNSLHIPPHFQPMASSSSVRLEDLNPHPRPEDPALFQASQSPNIYHPNPASGSSTPLTYFNYNPNHYS